MQQGMSAQRVSVPRAVIGALFISAGVLALMDAIGLFHLGVFIAGTWPLLFVLAGVLSLISSAKNWLWGLVLIGIGAVSFLNINNVVSFTVWELFWPVVIALIGVQILTRPARGELKKAVGSVNTSDQFALMSGSGQRIVTDKYTGGKATAIMGGVELDLRESKIVSNATIEVFALMGGVNIKVPAGVAVKSEVLVLLGGVDVKADASAAKDTPLLIITGTVALGGVEVKY